MKKRSTAPRRDPRQARSHAAVSAILEATALILREDGTAGFTTNRVAERAGVGIGTLYDYFPNKTAILVALARDILRADGEALVALLDRGDVSDMVRAVIRLLFARHRTDGTVRRIALGAYIGAGHAPEDALAVEHHVAVIATHPKSPLAALAADPVRVFVIAYAVLGIARTLSDAHSAADLPPAALEDETVRLVQAYLAAASAGALSAAATTAANSSSSPRRMAGEP